MLTHPEFSQVPRRGKHSRGTMAAATAALLWLSAPAGPAQSFTVLHHFGSTDGGTSEGLVTDGTRWYGATGGSGDVFALNPDGSAYHVLASLSASGLVLSGSTLCGAQPSAGASGAGVLFRMNADGSGYTLLHTFAGADGRWPVTDGLTIAGATLYGTTERGGASGEDGTVFRIDLDGSNFAVLKQFNGNDGSYPQGGVCLAGTVLYGTTRGGGSNSQGAVFRINTDGTGFAVLHSFSGSEGAWPGQVKLVLLGETLYGTTSCTSPSLYGGTIFALNIDGGNFRVLHRFPDGEHPEPNSSLTLMGSTLLGTTVYGGRYGSGTVFAMGADGSNYVVLKEFASHGIDGERPYGRLALSGTNVFGTTYAGGSNDCGVVFRVGLPLPVLGAAPASHTAEGQTSVSLMGHVGGMVLGYQWYFNGLTPLGSGTNGVLWLTNLNYSQAGSYTFVATNLFGAVTSPPAMLSVIPPVARRWVPSVVLYGAPGSVQNVECTDDLPTSANWTTLGAVLLTTPQRFFDLSSTPPPARFYRTSVTGGGPVPPRLGPPNPVPVLTLAGTLGQSLRVDGINTLGPTDAWFTLATVTLSNSPQLYFDVSAIGQPPRVYRLVPQP